ncbi:hypothetical protein METBIDRAFT_39828 [Metschnikowia bicuspidata var. bicuspidata NRRL YB-4993]|uniref:Enhancer of translation termination 1 n=1 Tax=Metschnikowia bicuspidata var. bicuspidata NRRL YB-4993 TaxID=869754 RepID=A0A1A0HE47_9ASCO|nr:hypothetical protein METBIDRAFT_39828 [Metschnikowia bicuspidata var. bicuspidata NRRL YB-4993]OBA22178.1 hypothetical protein METBIDRAFT_39828 [Metschnikowia bicuspidata var. bicuspidata NRRL YB-4993]
MASKRHLGLGKAAASKKRKSSENKDTSKSQEEISAKENELTVELGEEVNANDAMAQLRALWKDFIKTNDRNELKVNGIIHECDRILRKSHQDASGEQSDNEQIELTGEFYGIYGLALSSLAFFYTEEPNKVADFFAEAKDRISIGKQKFPDSISLLFAEARVLINEIPLVAIRPLTVDSKVSKEHKNVASLLDNCLAVWEGAEKLSEEKKKYKHYNLENSDFLQALDDLLDMIDNFGKESPEEKDSDAEDENEDEFELSPKHPLYAIVETDKYNLWWREHTQRFLNNLIEKIRLKNISEENNKDANMVLRRELSKRLGQSLLLEAEEPCNVFTTLTYYSKGETNLNGLTKEEARKIGQDLLNKALEFLRVAQDEEDPDSWAAVAEAMISLGNMYDLDSDEQEAIYKEAEEILMRANNATNGRYEKILENLTQA